MLARSRTVLVLREKKQTDSAAKARRSPVYVCGYGATNGKGRGGRYYLDL